MIKINFKKIFSCVLGFACFVSQQSKAKAKDNTIVNESNKKVINDNDEIENIKGKRSTLERFKLICTPIAVVFSSSLVYYLFHNIRQVHNIGQVNDDPTNQSVDDVNDPSHNPTKNETPPEVKPSDDTIMLNKKTENDIKEKIENLNKFSIKVVIFTSNNIEVFKSAVLYKIDNDYPPNDHDYILFYNSFSNIVTEIKDLINNNKKFDINNTSLGDNVKKLINFIGDLEETFDFQCGFLEYFNDKIEVNCDLDYLTDFKSKKNTNFNKQMFYDNQVDFITAAVNNNSINKILNNDVSEEFNKISENFKYFESIDFNILNNWNQGEILFIQIKKNGINIGNDDFLEKLNNLMLSIRKISHFISFKNENYFNEFNLVFAINSSICDSLNYVDLDESYNLILKLIDDPYCELFKNKTVNKYKYYYGNFYDSMNIPIIKKQILFNDLKNNLDKHRSMWNFKEPDLIEFLSKNDNDLFNVFFESIRGLFHQIIKTDFTSFNNSFYIVSCSKDNLNQFVYKSYNIKSNKIYGDENYKILNKSIDDLNSNLNYNSEKNNEDKKNLIKNLFRVKFRNVSEIEDNRNDSKYSKSVKALDELIEILSKILECFDNKQLVFNESIINLFDNFLCNIHLILSALDYKTLIHTINDTIEPGILSVIRDGNINNFKVEKECTIKLIRGTANVFDENDDFMKLLVVNNPDYSTGSNSSRFKFKHITPIFSS